MAARSKAGGLLFLDAVDFLYSAAEFAGLVDRYGDDVIQKILADAFTNAGSSQNEVAP
jgi:hypothetical protein